MSVPPSLWFSLCLSSNVYVCLCLSHSLFLCVYTFFIKKTDINIDIFISRKKRYLDTLTNSFLGWVQSFSSSLQNLFF
jgi:hypothetical protein